MSYTVHEVAELFQLHKNSVLFWLRSGLKKIDSKKPYLINGADLVDYLNSKQKKRKQKCRIDELFCFKCKRPRSPKQGSVIISERNIFRLKISARCETCNTRMFKDASVQRRTELESIYAPFLLNMEHIRVCTNLSTNCELKENSNNEPIQC